MTGEEGTLDWPIGATKPRGPLLVGALNVMQWVTLKTGDTVDVKTACAGCGKLWTSVGVKTGEELVSCGDLERHGETCAAVDDTTTTISLSADDFTLLFQAVKPECRFLDEAEKDACHLIVMMGDDCMPGAKRVKFISLSRLSLP